MHNFACSYLQLLGGVVNRYHGFGGSVCSVSSYSDSNQSVFAACGLDRYLRIYQTQPPSVLYKVYDNADMTTPTSFHCRHT